MKIDQLSVLFAEKNGIYSNFSNIDLWDKDRDARRYIGFNPVIAHPPCQRWGKMAKVNYARWGGAHNEVGNDDGCFFSALLAVRLNGGVLEHPATSYAWEFFGLKKPEKGKWIRSPYYGWTCEVWQSAYGHKANKATWLYYVGKRPPFDLRWNRPIGSHQIGFQDRRGKEKNKPTLNKKEANATPIDFRDELIKLAKWSRQP